MVYPLLKKASVGAVVAAAATLLISGCPKSNKAPECGPPIAHAGEDTTGVTGEPVILHGSFRLPPENIKQCQDDLETVTLQWEQNGGSDVTLSGANQAEASFVPAEPGNYSFRCKAIYSKAKDPTKQESQWDSVNVTVERRQCPPPIADAGKDQLLSTDAGTPVTIALDGSASHPTPTCPDLTLTYTWSVASKPAGANLTFSPNANAPVVTIQTAVFGTYEFDLVVEDSMGSQGRTDQGTARVTVNLQNRPDCKSDLVVEVVDALSGSPINGAHVQVVDASGATILPQDSDSKGEAHFTALAAGRRQSITVTSDDKVAAHPASQDTNKRPRYETTTVLDHCNSRITIPLRLTASGEAALPQGTLTGKIPISVFGNLPHSQKLAGPCTQDGDCQATYQCSPTPAGDKQCTPRSLLPFFSLGDPNISGQFRAVVVVPVFPLDSFSGFPFSRLFARPVQAGALLPGNLCTDDTFLNGLAPALGINVWGAKCSSVQECPNSTDYSCEKDLNGEFRCKDTSPLRNLRLDVPAGQNVHLVLLAGAIDVAMEDLLPILMQFLNPPPEGISLDVGGVLGAFKLSNLHVCLLSLPVDAGQTVDISSKLVQLDMTNCWNVDYQQQEVVDPIRDPNAMVDSNACSTDATCGWPDSGTKCMAPDPSQPDKTYCLIPLFRVRILSQQELILSNLQGDFNPTDPLADVRLHTWLPADAPYEEMCPGQNGLPESCSPRRFHQLPVPSDTDCSVHYGLSLVSYDFPPQHATLPEGGRVLAGFNFHYTTYSSQPQPVFLVPDLGLAPLKGSSLVASELFVRNVGTLTDGSYQAYPGRLGIFSDTGFPTRAMTLPAFLGLPSLPTVLDSGMTEEVTFVAKNPTQWPDPVMKKVYALLERMLPPTVTQLVPGTVATTWTQHAGLKGLVLSRVDRLIRADNTEVAFPDPWWRIYAPPGTGTLALPTGATPFQSGNEVMVTPWEGAFSSPFDYDIFSTDQIISRQNVLAEEGYPLQNP